MKLSRDRRTMQNRTNLKNTGFVKDMLHNILDRRNCQYCYVLVCCQFFAPVLLNFKKNYSARWFRQSLELHVFSFFFQILRSTFCNITVCLNHDLFLSPLLRAGINISLTNVIYLPQNISSFIFTSKV